MYLKVDVLQDIMLIIVLEYVFFSVILPYTSIKMTQHCNALISVPMECSEITQTLAQKFVYYIAIAQDGTPMILHGLVFKRVQFILLTIQMKLQKHALAYVE